LLLQKRNTRRAEELLKSEAWPSQGEMTHTEDLSVIPEDGPSSLLWGVPDDVLLLLKQYNFAGHDSPTYTVTGSPTGLHFIVVWPTKDSNLGDKVLQDIMAIHQITNRETAEASCQTDFDNTVSYPEYQNHDELDIEIENDCVEDDGEDSHSRSKLSIASADSGHHQMSSEAENQKEEERDHYYPMPNKEIKKDIDDVTTDIEEIDGSPILSESSDPIGPTVISVDEPKTMSSKMSTPNTHFTPFTPYARDSLDRLRHSIGHNLHSYSNQFSNMQYSGLALLNHQAIRNHQINMQNNTSKMLCLPPQSDYVHQSHPVAHHPMSSMGEPNVRQHLTEIYRKYNIVPKRIQGGTLEEVLRPPLKSQGHRTAHQIHLMRRMREVSSKMNLTDCTNPNYEDAVSVLLDSFEITAPYVNASDYRRKMNFLLRKRINNRRWFLRKKAKGAAQHDEDMDAVVAKSVGQETHCQSYSQPPPQQHPSVHHTGHHPGAPGNTGAVSQGQSREYLNPLIAAALVKQHSPSQMPPSLTIGGTPMIDHPSKELSVK
jgi:hypothetical protein